MSRLELRRQLFHLLYGPIIVLLHYYDWLSLEILGGIVIGGALMSFMIKKEKMGPVRWLLSHFERDHHMETFPGRGILFFTLGAFISLWLFPSAMAYAGILILSVGDAVTNLIGRRFGRIKTKLNPHKYVEGTLVGVLFSIPIAYYFVPHIAAAISASCIAMFLEMPHIRLFGFDIDDNLTIPVAASLTLNLFA